MNEGVMEPSPPTKSKNKKGLLVKLFNKKEGSVVKEERIEPTLTAPPKFNDDSDFDMGSALKEKLGIEEEPTPPQMPVEDEIELPREPETMGPVETPAKKNISDELIIEEPEVSIEEPIKVEEAPEPEEPEVLEMDAEPEVAEKLQIPEKPSAIQQLEEAEAEFDEVVQNIINSPTAVSEAEIHSFDKQAPDDHKFVLSNGQELASLRDLMTRLETMDPETFEHHVNDNRNDFANWIHDILENEALAEEARNKTAKHELLALLHKHEANITKEIEKAKLGKAAETVETAKQEMEQEKIRLAGLQNKYELRLKKLKKQEDDFEAKIKEVEEKEKSIREQEGNMQSAAQEIDSEKITLEREKSEFQENFKKEQEELEQKRQELNDLQRELDNKAAEISDKEANISKQEAEISSKHGELEPLKKKLENLEQELQVREETINKLETEVKEKEVHAAKVMEKVESKKKAEQEVAERYKKEKEAIEQELNELKNKLEEHRKYDHHIGTVEKHIEAKKEKVREGGFEAYLDQKLHEMKHGSVENTEGELPAIHDRTNPHIYELIEECRMLIEKGELEVAKEKYYKLKKEYDKADFHGPEKSSVYYAIREIYDDINLAMLT